LLQTVLYSDGDTRSIILVSVNISASNNKKKKNRSLALMYL
jgi:hypothetical protein